MTEHRPPIAHSVHPDGKGNYIIVGAPAHIAEARTLGANPASTDAIVRINRQIVDHYRRPKSARLWEQSVKDRNDLRRRLREAERQIQILRGTIAAMDDITWTRSTAAPTQPATGLDAGAVEFAVTPDRVLLRNSAHPVPVLEFTAEQWTAFLEGVDNGEFDIELEEDNDDE